MPLTQDQIRDRLTALLADMAPAVMAVAPTISVKSGDNLAALLAAQTIDRTIYLLAPGATFAGPIPFTKPCTLMTDEPAPVTRAVPTDPYATLVGAFTVQAPDVGFHNVAFAGDAGKGTILTTGLRTALDRVFMRGNLAGQHRGLCVNAASVSVRRCFVDNIASDQDAQAIAGWDGTADLLVDDCYLESTGENVIFGGADPSSAANIPTRITLQNSTLSKRLAWRGVAGLTMKNLLELKNAIGVTVVNNDLTYSWLSGQTGYAILLTVRNQDGTAPYSAVQHVLIEGNRIAHTGAGVQVLGQDDTPGRASVRMTDVALRGNVFTDMDPSAWGGTGMQLYLAGGPDALTIDGNDFEGKNLNSFLSLGGDPTKLATGLAITNNRFQEGDYGIHGDGAPALGKAALDMYAPGATVSGNTIVKGSSGRAIAYPAGMTVIAA